MLVMRRLAMSGKLKSVNSVKGSLLCNALEAHIAASEEYTAWALLAGFEALASPAEHFRPL
ncbi:hypothetical protein PMIN05_000272, partial [Paraphaeosphaeria minitans]